MHFGKKQKTCPPPYLGPQVKLSGLKLPLGMEVGSILRSGEDTVFLWQVSFVAN